MLKIRSSDRDCWGFLIFVHFDKVISLFVFEKHMNPIDNSEWNNLFTYLGVSVSWAFLLLDIIRILLDEMQFP